MQPVMTLAGALARSLDEEGIDYCALGPCAREHVELVVSSAALPRMAPLLRSFGTRHERELVQHARRADRVERYVLADARRERWTIDLRCDYYHAGQLIFTAEQLLRERSAPEQGGDCSRPAPAKEFLCHLLHCLARGALLEQDRAHLSALWQLDPPGVALQIERYWDAEREGGMIQRIAAAGNWEVVDAAARALKAALPRRGRARWRAWWSGRRDALERWLRPRGLLIACLGPAGSGKSSVIEVLRQAQPWPFSTVHTMELRPGVMRPASIKAGAATRAHRPRGWLGTLVKLAMFVVDYWLGYWARIRPRLARSALVLSDRYFDDVLVDPRRYRMRRPRASARLLLRSIPRPDLWLIFDISSQALKARTAQLGSEEATRQRGEYRRLLRGQENVAVLDASQPLERVAAQAEQAILAQLARQTARRLGLPLERTANSAATDVLLFFCRRDVPVLSRLVRILFNSDIQGRLPPDIHLPHPYGIVIHPQAALGRRVTLMQQVTIGGKDCGQGIAPVIGDDVHVGAGAKILGDVRIGHGATIGANAVVTRDVPPGVTVVGANRILPAARAGTHPSDGSVTRLPTGAERSARSQAR